MAFKDDGYRYFLWERNSVYYTLPRLNNLIGLCTYEHYTCDERLDHVCVVQTSAHTSLYDLNIMTAGTMAHVPDIRF
jgi:hypothetical protein